MVFRLDRFDCRCIGSSPCHATKGVFFIPNHSPRAFLIMLARHSNAAQKYCRCSESLSRHAWPNDRVGVAAGAKSRGSTESPGMLWKGGSNRDRSPRGALRLPSPKARPPKALRAFYFGAVRDTAIQDVAHSHEHAGSPRALQARAMTGVTRSPETDIRPGPRGSKHSFNATTAARASAIPNWRQSPANLD